METTVPYGFESLDSAAYVAGYDLEVDEDLNIYFHPKGRPYPATISCETIVEDGVYYYRPTISFPTLKYQEGWYNDDIPYYIEQFEGAGQLCRKIVEFSYDPSDYDGYEE